MRRATIVGLGLLILAAGCSTPELQLDPKLRTYSREELEEMDEIEMPGVWIHPVDAEQRGIRNRDMVMVYNDYGKIQIPAIVTGRIRPGVTAISQGGWYTPDENGADQRGSINVLTGSRPTPLAKGNPQHTNLVEIRKTSS